MILEIDVKGRDRAWQVTQVVHAANEAVYRFDQLKSKAAAPKKPLKKLTLILPGKAGLAKLQATAKAAQAIANGINLTRDLGNLPPNICHPTYLANQAQKLKRAHPDLNVTIV